MKRSNWVVVLGCAMAMSSCEDKTAPKPATASTTQPPVVTSKTPPSATPTVVAEPPPFGKKDIDAGRHEDGAWTRAFAVERKAGNQGLAHLASQKACSSLGKSLCTDTQWTRACAAHPSLGKLETWTITGVGGERFVVRGGKAGCDQRNVVPGSDKNPSRVAVCCSRAVGITTTNPNSAFLKATAKRLGDYETALKKQDMFALKKQYDDKVLFHGKERAQDALLELHQADFRKNRDQWSVFDTCHVTIEKVEKDSQLVSDCRTVFYRDGKTLTGMQRLIWGGPDTKLQAIGDATTKKTAEAPDDFEGETEQKERVGVLLVAD